MKIEEMKAASVAKMNLLKSGSAVTEHLTGKGVIRCQARMDRNPRSIAKHIRFAWAIDGKPATLAEVAA
jgi:hypothetical protein